MSNVPLELMNKILLDTAEKSAIWIVLLYCVNDVIVFM